MYSPFLAHYGIKGMKWGVRRYQNKDGSLTSEGRVRYGNLPGPNSVANNIFKKAMLKEPKITSDIKGSGMKLHGLEHRIKTKESIKRKVEKEIKEENKSLADASSDIKDAVRYTTLSSTKDFVNNYDKFKRYMESKGYSEVRCKNYFQMFAEGKVKHKSVQSTYEDPEGYLFEVQFQTPESQKAKDLKLPLYEERRKVGIDKQRAAILEKKMEDLALAVPNPPNINSIETYDKLKKLF